VNGGGGTGSSHDDMRLSRLYQELIEWQEPRFGQEYDLTSGLDRYRAWIGKHIEDGAPNDVSAADGLVAVPAGPGAAGTDEELEDRGALPASVTQAVVEASGAFQAPLAGGMEWRADLAVMELYSRQYRALVRLAAMLVRDVPTAEEVVQDAFVATHDGWHRLKDTEKALAYLRQAVVNKSRSVLRHRMVVEKNLQDVPPDMPSAEHGAFVLLERSAVIAALRDLPGRQREAIVLRYYADLSEAEIAAAMGISRGAVKSHTARGMASLRAALEQELWRAPAPGARRHSGNASPSSCVVLCTTPWITSSRRQTAWNRFARESRSGRVRVTARRRGAVGGPGPGPARTMPGLEFRGPAGGGAAPDASASTASAQQSAGQAGRRLQGGGVRRRRHRRRGGGPGADRAVRR
jgi:RNA polymerase sigma-70 factor (sigma-E family)